MLGRLVWIALAAVVCAACGDNRSPQSVLTSGARLDAMWFVTANNQKVAPAADHWYDSQLQIPCTIDRGDDGVTRCLPRTFAGALTALEQFSDAACTQPAIFGGFPPVSVCPSTYNPHATTWARGPAPAPTCAGYPWVPITGPLPSDQRAYGRDITGTCVFLGTSTGGYSIGATVAPTTFVAFADAAPTGTGRLQPLVRIADDGARDRTDGLWDEARGARCVVEDPGDGITRCLPSESTGVVSYLDALCTQPVVRLFESCGATAPTTVTVRGAMMSRYHELGPAIAPALRYVIQGGTCQLSTEPTGTGTFHALGAEIPLDDFARVHDLALTTGRLVEHGWADDDGNLLVPGVAIHDVELDADIEPMILDTATVQLLPKDWTSVLHFADAACTQPLVEADRAPHVAVIESLDTAGCSTRRLFAVGAEVHPTQVFEHGGSSCVPATLPSQRMFATGPELPRSTFVTVTVRTE
jgi:hypothetical protein